MEKPRIKSLGCNKILAIGTRGILIAHELNEDNTWNWTTAIDSQGINASNVTTGTLLADIIKAGTLSDINGNSWINMEDGTFSLANGQLTFDGSEFIVKIGSNKIDDLLNASFNVITNKEHIVVTLDTNSFPVEDVNHTITFRVLQGNTTSETPCIINKITPSNEIEGVNFTINNNSCTMSISKETRLFGIVEESFEVELEIKDYKIFKTITWSTISQGRDGQDGANGTPGVSSYFHIKYAPNDNPTADEMTETVNTYIGTYVDEIKEDSNDPTKYTWSKLIGEDGKDGIVGKDGEDGVSSYLHIKYSDDMVSFTENNGETPGIYMGQYVDEIKEDSLVFNDYVWAKIKGEDGKDGTNGTPGASSYFHVKYAPNNNPTPEQMTDTPQQYIGTYVDDNIQDSDDPRKYTWIKIQGQDGTSISIDHTVSELPDTGIVGEYYYVTSTGVLWRYEDTGWVELGKIQGEQGIPGKDGENGKTNYLHIRYSNDNGVTFTTNNGEDVGMYMGTYVDFTEEDSSDVNDYKWVRLKGEDGSSASYVKIISNNNLFIMSKGSNEYLPSNIVLTPEYTNCTFGKWQYSTDGGADWTMVTNGLNGLTVSSGILTINNDSPLFTEEIDNISFKVTASDGSSDIVTIARLKDGIDGDDGISATNVFLTNENHTFMATNDGKAIASSISFDVNGYVGTEEESITFGTITGVPNGMSITKNDSNSTNAKLTISVTTDMTSLNGTITIPCICNGITFNKQFSYALSVPGKDGQDGINGTNGINGTSSYFHIKYAPVENPTANQMTETVNTYIGTYVDNNIADSNNPSDYKWSKFVGQDGNNGNDGLPGKDGKDGTTYYLHVKYSNDGSTFTANSGETPGDYLGQLVDTNKEDSLVFNDYTWKKIKGEDGNDGISGTSSYFHIKYSPVENPTASQMTEVPSDYIGTYVDEIKEDSNDPSKYTWSRFRGQDGNDGEQGLPGEKGKDGTTYYLHIKYSDDGTTFTANNGETPGKYLGQLVDTTEEDSLVFSDYTWKKIEGDVGANASYVKIIANNQAFLKPSDSEAYSPSSIKLTPVFTNSTYSKWQYSTNNGSSWTDVTSGSNGLSISSGALTISNTCSLYTDSIQNISFKVLSKDSTVYDVISILRLKDGVNGTNGSDGKGIKAITNYYLAISSSSGVTTSTSGWTETIQTISTSKKYLWNYEKITYTDNTTYSTSPTIIGVHGTDGTNGTNGTNGKGISSITEYYLATSSSSGVTTSTSGWTTTVQSMTSTNKYLWNYEVIKYTDNSTTTGSPKIIGVYGDKGATGSAGKDSINVILGNENHTFVASSDGKAVATSVSTSVLGYVGTTAKSCTIGTISGLPTGMTATINNNSTSASITFTVTTSLTTKNGAVTIPVTCNGVTINKIFSYSLAVAGANGSSSKLIKINAPTNVFKSTDGGVTFKPSSMDFIFTVQNATFSKWQYSIDNGSSWTDVGTTVSGMSANGATLSITSSCGLFTESVTAISIKCLSTTSTVYDTLTIYKLYDRIDINEAFEEMELTVTQSNTKWEACFKNSNANNLFLNSDAKTGTTDEWVDNGGGLTISKANAFPFYGSKENYFKTSFKSSSSTGVRYKHDIILEPNTDYIYEGYIYTNVSVTGTDITPLNFRLWTGTTYSNMRDELCTILDYRQTLTPSRFVKCYVHFKTNNISETIYGRFFIYKESACSVVGFKRMSLKKGVIETEWTQHPNEVKSSVVSIDETGVNVKHSEIGTTTNMNSQGFSIMDAENGDVLAWLSSKEQWTELKVDKVFANNIENIYTGDSYLYVDHSKTVAGNGTSSKPFNSFAQLSAYLQATPVINYDLYITVKDPGFVINEMLILNNLKGLGFIKITLEGQLTILNQGGSSCCMEFHQIDKFLWIVGSRELGSSTTGAVLRDGGDGNGYGIWATDTRRIEVDAITIACKNTGLLAERCHAYTWHCDFGKCNTAVELRYQSLYYTSDDVGSCSKFCILRSGSFAYWGAGTTRPQGSVDKSNGVYYDGGVSLTPTASPRYPSANPTPPSTSGQIFTYTYNCTSKQSYQYNWSNWSTDGSCKQGAWGNLSPYVKKLA